jgi:hypothetical protein
VALKDSIGAKADQENEKIDELLGGATSRQLAALFHKSDATVKEQLAEIKPIARRRGKYVYSIHEAAPYLCRPKNARQIANFIRTARPQDMPPILTKEFWNAQRARQAFLAGEGKLWDTDRIVGLLSEVFGKIRMDLLLLPDEIERKQLLTDEQINFIREKVDATLATAAEALVLQFNNDDGEFAVKPGSYHDAAELERLLGDLAAEDEGVAKATQRDDADDILFGLEDDPSHEGL